MRVGLFSLIPWSFLDQRPQVMTLKLQKWGFDTYYFSPFNFDCFIDDYPHPWDEYEKRAWEEKIVAPGIKCFSPLFIPLQHRFKKILHLNKNFYPKIIKKIKELNLDLAIVVDPHWGKILKEASIPFIYDHVDDTHQMEVALKEEFYQEYLFCEKNSLFNIYIQPNIARRYGGLYIPNGINKNELCYFENHKKMFDAVCLSCYSDWFDMDSVFKSEKRILLIGPMDHGIKTHYEQLRHSGKSNILWIPKISRKLASMWLNLASVGLLPFKQDHGVVDYVMPLKLIEYFKLGLSCVSYVNRGIQEEFGDLVHFYSPSNWLNFPNFDQAIDNALMDLRIKERIDSTETFYWDSIMEPLHKKILDIDLVVQR